MISARAALYVDGDQVGRTFAIIGYHPRQLNADRIERCLELLEIPASQCHLVGRSGGDQQGRVVGAGVPFDADAIEALIDGRGDSPLSGFRGESGIGHDHSQQSRHIGADHPRSLRHPGDADFLTAECQPTTGDFVRAVGRRNATGRREKCGLVGPQLRGRGRHSASDFVHRQKMANHTRRHDEHLIGVGPASLRRQPRHFFRIAQPPLARAGVRIPRIDHDGPYPVRRRQAAVPLHGRSDNQILCVNRSGHRRTVGDDQCQIFLASDLLDAAVDARQHESQGERCASMRFPCLS